MNENHRPLRSRRIARRFTAVVAGGGLALASVIGFKVLTAPPRPPTLERRAFDEAFDRWRSSGPANYRIAVRVEGRQPARYEVQVLDRVVQFATRNGQPLTNGRTLGTWAVPGMFNTIQIDLDNQTRKERGELLLRAEFDPQLGIPRRYERVEMRSYAHDPMTWEVLEFRREASAQQEKEP